MELSKSKWRRLRLWLLALLLLAGPMVHAQTFAEWWSQKKTQISYLGQQIAALQVYGTYLKQGYRISQNGLGTIRDWTKGEFDLHSGYYTSLKTVNPEVKDDPKASAIVQYLLAIPGQFDQVKNLEGLDADTRAYIALVRDKVLSDGDAEVSELQTVMTSGKATMTDDERIKRLDAIYKQVKDLYAFTLSSCSHVKALLMKRQQELLESRSERGLYAIP